jgi:DNA-directed RNA polymerase specialized sigma24 family protein
MSKLTASYKDLPMTTGKSVTQWINQLKEGERDAVQKLWEGYFARLVQQTRQWLRHTPTQAVEAEDVALSAFKSVCLRAEQGRFPQLFDRDDLWQLLVAIAFRKACNQIQHEARRQPRNGRVYHTSALGDGEGASFADALSREPDPVMVVQTAEEYRRLLAMLPNAELRNIAVSKMEGYTNEEIAGKLKDGAGRSLATVERKLAHIRTIWAKEIAS